LVARLNGGEKKTKRKEGPNRGKDGDSEPRTPKRGTSSGQKKMNEERGEHFPPRSKVINAKKTRAGLPLGLAT